MKQETWSERHELAVDVAIWAVSLITAPMIVLAIMLAILHG